MKKTFKRELAVYYSLTHTLLIGFVCYLAYTDSPTLQPMIDMVIGLAVFVYGYSAAAFGLDWYGKQKPKGLSDE